jgi:Tfp pilus assembly protein PilN
MIQFNLLPEVKLDYIKAKRTKRSVMLISTIVAGASVGLLIMLFLTVSVLQKQHINNLNKDIQKYTDELQSIEDLDRILTVQNQLNKLPELHDQKAVLSRLKDYISQVTPAQVSYAEIELNTELNTMRFAGSADSLKTINLFVDTLKFTNYKIKNLDSDGATVNAFKDVVLTTFETNEEKGFTYEINLVYDPAIFSSQSEISLTVPNIITTRSATEKPTENLIKAIDPSNQPAEGTQ